MGKAKQSIACVDIHTVCLGPSLTLTESLDTVEYIGYINTDYTAQLAGLELYCLYNPEDPFLMAGLICKQYRLV